MFSRPAMLQSEAVTLLTGLCGDGVIVEVTHRSKRRLFGLADLAPLRDDIRPPYRPEPGRGRGRPPSTNVEIEPPPAVALPEVRAMTPSERRSVDYSEIEGAMAQLEAAIRNTRWKLEALARPPARSASSLIDKSIRLVRDVGCEPRCEHGEFRATGRDEVLEMVSGIWRLL